MQWMGRALLLAAVVATAAVNSAAGRSPTVNGTHLPRGGDAQLGWPGFRVFSQPQPTAYLAVGALPPLSVANSRGDGNGPTVSAASDFMEPRPTLGGFLAYLEEERQAAEAEKKASETGEDPSGELAADGSSPEANADDAGETASAEAESSPLVLQTTDPFSQQSLFPRPDRNRLRRDWLQLYFPVDDLKSDQAGILIPMSYDAAFLPPGFEGMRSTATFMQEP